MKLVVVGAGGYVGQVHAASLAKDHKEVVGVDVKPDVVEQLNSGVPTIHEEGLDGLLEDVVRNGRLHFTTDLAQAVDGADAVFVCVGTYLGENGLYDMSHMNNAMGALGRHLQPGIPIFNKSTINVGDSRRLIQIVQDGFIDRGIDEELLYGFAGEFLAQGSAVENARKPAKVVCGTEEEPVARMLKRITRSLRQGGAPFFHVGLEEAELIKGAQNSFLALKIMFFNELAVLCDKVGANVYNVINAIISDDRISKKFVHPGPGYAGSCFPKDTIAYATIARQKGVPQHIVEAAIKANGLMRHYMSTRIFDYDGDRLEGKHYGLLGLSFKDLTDDVRDTAVSDLVLDLTERGANITAFDPYAKEKPKDYEWGRKIDYAGSIEEALEGKDALIIMTNHPEFKQLDLDTVRSALKRPIIFDARNIYGRPGEESRDDLIDLGFDYHGIGITIDGWMRQ